MHGNAIVAFVMDSDQILTIRLAPLYPRQVGKLNLEALLPWEEGRRIELMDVLTLLSSCLPRAVCSHVLVQLTYHFGIMMDKAIAPLFDIDLATAPQGGFGWEDARSTEAV